jgi:hypothetical protein
MRALEGARRAAWLLLVNCLTLGFSFVVFLAAYVLMRQLAPPSIPYVEGIVVAAGSAILSSFIAYHFGAAYLFQGGNRAQVIQLIFLSAFLVNYAFVITFPTLLDRSISVMMISFLDRAKHRSVPIDQLNQAFIEVYVAGDTQTRKRVAEQVAIGNVTASNDQVAITSRGREFARLNRIMASLFNIQRTYVDAELTENRGVESTK